MNTSTLTRAELRAALAQALADVAPDIDMATVADAVPLRDQFDFDSMDTLHLALALKQRLGIDIPDGDSRELESISRCVAYLARRLGTPSA